MAALTAATMNADLLSAQYAVRGEIVTRAMAHAEALRRGESRPFKKLTVRVWPLRQLLSRARATRGDGGARLRDAAH